MAYTVNTSAAALNRAFNNANATPTAFAATAAALTADQIAAANTFDDASLTDLALSTKVLTNMGILPSTVAEVVALEAALADYFAGPGKGNRGFVVLQLAEILSGFAATDVFYGAAATAWNAEVAASVADSAPGTLALTTSTTDNLVGGSAADIFTALNTALASANTLNATDKVAGGAGNDTLQISQGTTWSGFTSGSVTGVETVELTNTTTDVDRDFNATGITGATTYTLNASTGNYANITNVGTGLTAVNVNGTKSATAKSLNVSFATGAAEIAGTANAVALNLSTVGTTASVTIDLDKFETVNITSTGTNKVTVGGDDAKAITVAGAGAITVGDVSSATTSFDASAATGAVTVTTTAAAAGALKTVKTSSGSATGTITANMQDLVGNATIVAGSGTADKLNLSSTAAAAVEYNMSGVETLALGTVSGAGVTISAAKTTGLQTVTLASTTAQAVEFVNMGANAYTFTNTGAVAGSSAVTSDHTGATTVTYAAGSTNDATAADVPTVDYTVASSTGALTVAVGAYVNGNAADVTAANASSVALTVASGKTSAGTELTTWDSTITAAKATSVSVNSSGILGGTIAAVKATSAEVTNGTSGGALTLNVPLAKTLAVTTGATLDFTGSTISALETLTVAANGGTTTIGAIDKAASITLSGTGTTSKVSLGALGSTGQDYSLALTASGLKSDLVVGAVQVAAGYDTTINVAGVTGDVDLSTINSTGTRGKNVTISANGVGETFDVGNVFGTGDVTVNASGTTGAATIGNLYGDNVSVDVRGSGAGSTVGTTIEAKTSLALNLHELATGATYSVAAATGSKNLAITVNGGINADVVNVTGVSGQTGVTLSGNLGAGTDTASVTSSASSSAQTISLANLTSYATATIVGGSGADTITGGAGVDTITGGAGADTLTGGAGKDVFIFNGNDSTVDAYDTIVDFEAGDQLVSGNVTTIMSDAAITGTTTAPAVNAYGVVSFAGITLASAYDTLAEKVTLIDALAGLANGETVFFAHEGSNFAFISSDAVTNDVVVKLVGSFTLPTAAVAAADATGITGFAA